MFNKSTGSSTYQPSSYSHVQPLSSATITTTTTTTTASSLQSLLSSQTPSSLALSLSISPTSLLQGPSQAVASSLYSQSLTSNYSSVNGLPTASSTAVSPTSRIEKLVSYLMLTCCLLVLTMLCFVFVFVSQLKCYFHDPNLVTFCFCVYRRNPSKMSRLLNIKQQQ